MSAKIDELIENYIETLNNFGIDDKDGLVQSLKIIKETWKTKYNIKTNF